VGRWVGNLCSLRCRQQHRRRPAEKSADPDTRCCAHPLTRRLEGQVKQQAKQLSQVEDLLTNSTGPGWFGRAQLPARDLLLVLTDKKAASG
jgi:hypothetical protein